MRQSNEQLLNRKRKYPFNQQFLDSVDTQEKAYFLGLMYSDGHNNTKSGVVSITLQEKDKDILEKINSLLGIKKPLEYKITDLSRQNTYRLSFISKYLSNRLIALGCPEAKTFKIEFPTFLDSSLFRHFIRGYMDGDGHIGYERVNVTGTESFCNTLKEILNELSINCYLNNRHPNRNNNIRTLEVSGRSQVKNFLDWIYSDATIFLNRKHEKYKADIEIKNQKMASKILNCNIDGCESRHLKKGYCQKHWYRMFKGKKKLDEYKN